MFLKKALKYVLFVFIWLVVYNTGIVMQVHEEL